MNARFYLDSPLTQDRFTLTMEEFHHLARVLRLGAGDKVELVNGRGILVQAHVEKIEKHSAELTLVQRHSEPPSSPSLLLGLSLIRLSRLEWVLEKGTELGADGFFLFPAERSEQKHLSPHQLERLHHITIAALKQCGRLYLPNITLMNSLADVLKIDALCYYGDPNSSILLSISTAPKILFLVGPEGGFSSQETELFKHQGVVGTRLHKNILRAETAPLVALTLLSGKNLCPLKKN
jgi:16S rRNA (uracil1498-N3)-methyltransferase